MRKIITQAQVEHAIRNTRSNLEAARFLNVSIITYKKYASQYFSLTDPTTSLYEKHSNISGKGISKLKSGVSRNQVPLEDIFANKHPNYDKNLLRIRLIRNKLKDECCEICGFREQRVTDGKVPLLLNFIDDNRKNYTLENLQILCFNCTFLLSRNTSLRGPMKSNKIIVPLSGSLDQKIKVDVDAEGNLDLSNIDLSMFSIDPEEDEEKNIDNS